MSFFVSLQYRGVVSGWSERALSSPDIQIASDTEARAFHACTPLPTRCDVANHGQCGDLLRPANPLHLHIQVRHQRPGNVCDATCDVYDATSDVTHCN